MPRQGLAWSSLQACRGKPTCAPGHHQPHAEFVASAGGTTSTAPGGFPGVGGPGVEEVD